jgi:hypothetical protein
VKLSYAHPPSVDDHADRLVIDAEDLACANARRLQPIDQGAIFSWPSTLGQHQALNLRIRARSQGIMTECRHHLWVSNYPEGRPNHRDLKDVAECDWWAENDG